MQLFADYHTHTRYSHGKGTVEDNVKAALKRGLKEVAISDHGPAHPFVGIKNLKTLRKIKEDIERCREKYAGIKILLGIEANIISTSGELDITPPFIAELDILLVGLHTGIIPKDISNGLDLMIKNWGSRYSPELSREVRRINTGALISAVENYPVNIVVHPGLKLNIDTYKLAEVCALRGTALEINSSHGIKTREFTRAAAQTDVKFVINSDAHSPEDVGNLEAGSNLAVALGLNPGRIINANPEKRLEKVSYFLERADLYKKKQAFVYKCLFKKYFKGGK